MTPAVAAVASVVAADDRALVLTVTPWLRSRVRLALGVAITLVFVMGTAVEGARLLGHDTLLGLGRLLNLGQEANLPTWYASATLLVAAMLAAAVAALKLRARDPFARRWVGLSALLVLMSLDETAVIHELSSLVAMKVLQSNDLPWYVYYAWIVPGAVVVGVVLWWLYSWSRSLSPPVRRQITLAAGVYFGGALGVEILEAACMAYLGGAAANRSALYSGLWMTQELLEMIGVAVFILAMLDQLAEDGVTASVSVAADRDPD